MQRCVFGKDSGMTTFTTLLRSLLPILIFVSPAIAGQQSPEFDRTVLPIALPKPPPYTELNARNVTPPPRTEVKAPKDAPNVVVVLIDDLGFGAPSTFGGPISMPTLDQLANRRPQIQ